MAEIQIDRRKIDAVMKDVVQMLEQRQHSNSALEVVMGLAESIGRIIAVQDGTFILHNEMKDVAIAHLVTTLRTAYAAKGMNPEAIES